MEGRLGNGVLGHWRATRRSDVLSIVAGKELRIAEELDEKQDPDGFVFDDPSACDPDRDT